eukprot:gene3391-3693_t
MSAGGAARLRVGVIGAGANTKKMHPPKLQGIGGVSVTRVANRSAESSRAAAAEFGIPHVAESWEALVAAEDVDAVVIGT